MNSRFNDPIPDAPNMITPQPSRTRNSRRVIRRDLTPPIIQTGIVPQSGDNMDDNLDPIVAAPLLPAVSSPSPGIAPTHTPITVAPLDLPGSEFRSGLDRRKQNRELLMEWLRTALVDGVDYGKVHIASKDKCEYARGGRVKECPNQYHWSKPSLFKPGAEKITGMLGMTVHFPSLAGYETAFLSGQQITQVMMRCELHDAQGRVVAEGVGARNITQDYGDINKSLKMAEKSAHIDATLRLAGLSEVFTQDIEDHPPHDDDPRDDSRPASQARPRSPRPPRSSRSEASSDNGFSQPSSPAARPVSSASAPSSAPPASGPHTPLTSDVEIIGPDDVAMVEQRIVDVGISGKRVLAWINKVTKGAVTRFDQMNVAQCTTLLKRLDLWAQEAQDPV